MAPSDRRRLDPHRSRADERRAAEGVAQPARPAAAAGQELPRDVEAALMSRDNILHKVRTALGRSAGQPRRRSAAGAPARSRGRYGGAHREHARPRGGAGRKGHAAPADPRARGRAEVIAGKTAVASNAPFLAECGITSLPGVRTGITDRDELRAVCATADIGITSADYALADTGTLVMLSSPQEARLISLLPPAHIAVVPARPHPDAASTSCSSLLPRPRRTDQFHGADHRPQPHRRYRADPGARRPRPRPDHRRHRGIRPPRSLTLRRVLQ